MEIQFSDLTTNDIAYVVYKNNESMYVIEQVEVLENKMRSVKIPLFNIYDEDNVRYEDRKYIKIKFHNITYSRYYDDYYNIRGHILISSPDNYEQGPSLDVFPTMELAKNFLIDYCNSLIKYSNSIITKEQNMINLYKQSIDNIL